MPDEIVIRVENVSKNFVLPHQRANSIKSLLTGAAKRRGDQRGKETQHALHGISFEIKQGEFFGIVGRNGSGKSTLLKILAGIYQPTKGSVQTRGKLVPFIELGVGFNNELTGRENVYLNGALLGFSQKEVDAMYDDIVSFAELERFMDQKLKNYSSGMQVRLAFSVATRSEADILLVDEVLAVGDADFQRKCFEYFRKLKKEAKTVIFVSHDMDAIREYCDRAVLIEDSRLINEGKPIDIATQYSKLFMETSKEAEEDKTGKRWGNGHIKYTQINLTKTIMDEDYLTINLRAKANVDIEEPVFGFTIRNSSGQPITGTNSRIVRYKIDRVSKGENIKMTWQIPNIFSDGKHSLDLAIVAADGITACDWWEGAAHFMAYKQDRTPYLVTPKMLFKVDA